MKSLRWTILLVLIWPGAATAKDPPRVPAKRLPGGVIIPSYRRLEARTGFRWEAGHPGRDGNWIPGTWVPIGPTPKNRAWAAGRFYRGSWQPGHWVNLEPGQSWLPGHYNRFGRWIEGHPTP